MLLCTREHITDLLLVGYVNACEAQNPGLVERTIEAVSGEICTMLAYRYPQPWPGDPVIVPELVRYIASVISAYRTVEAITSLVGSEASDNNEWIPLQKQWRYCTDMLKELASGRLKLPLPDANADREEPSFVVATPDRLFDLRGF